MEIVDTIEELRLTRWAAPALSWGFVPTMGALHEGHLELVRRARAENDRVVVSIFVNPKQFNDAADLDRYPRQVTADAAMLREAGADLLWTPAEAVMYPDGFQTYVEVERLTTPLEGAARSGHFRGVTTVVAKLFNAVQPTRAYFGQKDAQQAAVIRQMVRDLAFNVDVVVCPIVREPDGLAMSSRNAGLNPAERTASLVLYRALLAAESAWAGGERDAERLREVMAAVISTENLARIDYVSAADPDTLEELESDAHRVLLNMAVFIGQTRLIDNLVLSAD